MIGRLISRSLKQRKLRIAVAIFAVIMGASMVAALLSISWDMKEKLSVEARKFGANLVLQPADDSLTDDYGDNAATSGKRFLSDRDVKAVQKLDYIVGAAPYLYGEVQINGRKVILTGTDLKEALKVSPWWKINGQWRDSGQGLLVGEQVAIKYKIKLGDTIAVNPAYSKTGFPLRVTGILKANGPEDSQIFMTLLESQKILNLPGKVASVQISVMTDKKDINAAKSEVEQIVPGSKGKVIRQIADAEQSLLKKIQWLMILVTIAVLAASVLSVTSTMTSTVLERRKEIGIMKALGAENKKVAGLFYWEAAIIGLTGGVTGYFVGLVLSQVIGKSVFSTFISFRPTVFPITVLVALAVTLAASRFPVQRALEIDPIITLRGE